MRATGSIAGLGAKLRLLDLGCVVGLATGPMGCGDLEVGGYWRPGGRRAGVGGGHRR